MKNNNINFIARRGIALIEDLPLREALDAAYESAHSLRAVGNAHSAFNQLVSAKWPTEKLCRFISGWRSCHGTALFVSGLMIRLHREASLASAPTRSVLHEAAFEIGEIIPEDTGLDDVPHNERFDQFANQIVGNDDWKLDRYSMPVCLRFREYVKEQRLSSAIEEGILTTAASENWNTGEYTHLNTLICPWMTDYFGCSIDVAIEKSAYISVHAGNTELGHFLHALSAWQLYCKAHGNKPDPMKAKHVLEVYLQRVGDVFEELEELFTS